MTLLNTAANLGGTWPASFIMWLVGRLTSTTGNKNGGAGNPSGGKGDPYFSLQLVLSGLGILWLMVLGPKVNELSHLPDDAWRTHLLDEDGDSSSPIVVGSGNGNASASLMAGSKRLDTDSDVVDLEALKTDETKQKNEPGVSTNTLAAAVSSIFPSGTTKDQKRE